ncbi:hypothetical protein [Sphingopyxis sp.]|uniref:hypothetical protein n=1 Tax=Sphingopyxis sp. TaxID=1908224 RepID=UPI0026118427|nr:hypothetical protein [Sphingopyxis sp.]MCW0199881.1 hypothetical protein [Sphingopyxis sp.]
MIRPILSFAIGIAALPTLTMPAPASAQDMINNLPDYTSAWVMGDLMQRRGRDSGDTADSKTNRKPDPQAILARQATYTPSAAVRTKVDSAFASYLAGRRPASAPVLLRALAADSPPGSAFTRLLAAELGNSEDAIRRQLQQGQLQGDYGRWLTTMGYSDRNLFDVNTAFLMHSWSIANGGVTTRYPKITFRTVRDDLMEHQDPGRMAGRSNTLKQEEAQSFALFTALLVSAWENADTRERAVLSSGVAKLGKRIGIDYRQVRLSAEGFAFR